MPDQTTFTAALLDPEMEVPEGIIQPDGTRASKRFDVYRNNVVTSLIDALGSAFPVIKQLVGEQFFDAMAGHYVRLNPPQSPLMMFYGEGFPEFLESFEPVQKLPYLPDMARVELARRTSYHAKDDPVAPPEALGQIPPEDLGDVKLILHASVQMISSAHPIFSIWRFNATDDKTPVNAQSEDVLISRPRNDVGLQRLPSGGFQFLSALRMGQTLTQAAELGEKAHEDFDLSDNIGTLLAAEILSRIEQ